MDRHYNTDHLSTDEIKEIAISVWNHWQEVVRSPRMFEENPDELSEEYDFWIGELEKRLGYVPEIKEY